MKVIGMTGDYRQEYICTVSHSEIEKFLGLYYDKLPRLKVGDDVDLGKGYNHAAEIASAMRTTQELIKAHQPIITAILNGLRIETIMRENPPPAAAEPHTNV